MPGMEKTERFVGEIVALTRDCELGEEGDQAIVTDLSPCPSGGQYMTLYFPGRREPNVLTGADYRYLDTSTDPLPGYYLVTLDDAFATLAQGVININSGLCTIEAKSRVYCGMLDILRARDEGRLKF